MTPRMPRSSRTAIAVLTALGLLVGHTVAQAAPPSNLITTISGMPANSWVKLNTNNFLDAAPPLELRGASETGFGARPDSVIYAWSSFVWDSNRSELLMYGGGHANYAGNEVYKWSGASQAWGRASLPSQVVPIPGLNAESNWAPVDGAMNAPTSAHTYDSTTFLPTLDRYLVLGGAAYNSGGSYTLQVDATTSRATGPYLFDPSRADPNKVGGTNGSGADANQPGGIAVNSIGGQMWQNRDLVAQGIGGLAFIESTSAVAKEAGKDVVYFTARSGGTIFTDLYKLSINNLANPSLDTLTKVGTFFNPAINPVESPVAIGSAGYDPNSKLYVAMGGGNEPFVAWDLDNAGAGNPSYGISPIVIGGTFIQRTSMGLEWDPIRGQWMVWDGGGTLWGLKAPVAGTIAGQWTLTKVVDDSSFAANAKPADVQNTGVRGKWKYASDLDVFVALEDNSDGNLWFYKPLGWVNPTAAVPELPTGAMFLIGAGCLLALSRRRHRR
jgi:hypothetical protein